MPIVALKPIPVSQLLLSNAVTNCEKTVEILRTIDLVLEQQAPALFQLSPTDIRAGTKNRVYI